MAPRFSCVGLPEGDVVIGKIGEDVPESVVCKYFGQKSSKSSWKYHVGTASDEQEAILALYERVYGCSEIPNKELTLQFARGLILMSLGWRVDWAQFTVERKDYQEKIALKREATARERSEREAQEGILPANLAKRRCIGPTRDFLNSLKLSIKSEDVEVGGLMGRRGVGKDRSNVSPCWVKEDFKSMEGVIDESNEVVKHCRACLSAVTSERVDVEDKLRRAKMTLSDRQFILRESELELENLSKDELVCKAAIEESKASIASLEQSRAPSAESANVRRQSLMAQLLIDEKNFEAFQFKKVCEERTIRLSTRVILECEGNISSLDLEMSKSGTRNCETLEKVASWEGLLLSMGEQLRRMQEGGGAAFFLDPS